MNFCLRGDLCLLGKGLFNIVAVAVTGLGQSMQSIASAQMQFWISEHSN